MLIKNKIKKIICLKTAFFTLLLLGTSTIVSAAPDSDGDTRVCYTVSGWDYAVANGQCAGALSGCSGWASNPYNSPTYLDNTNGIQGGCYLQWKLEGSNLKGKYRVCRDVQGPANQCGYTGVYCSGWTNNPSWSTSYKDDTDQRSGYCNLAWRIEENDAKQDPYVYRLCYDVVGNNGATSGGQCAGTLNGCSDWSNQATLSDGSGWTPYYSDNTQEISGGCEMKWRVERIERPPPVLSVQTILYADDNSTVTPFNPKPSIVKTQGEGPTSPYSAYVTYGDLGWWYEGAGYSTYSQVDITALDHFNLNGNIYKLGYYIHGVSLVNTTLTNDDAIIEHVTDYDPFNIWFVYKQVFDRDGDGSWHYLDCDDNDNDRYPGNSEVCDGKDNDCDGKVDEEVTTAYYPDADGDGYGYQTRDPPIQACSSPSGYAASHSDCNDGNAYIHPGATEFCNNADDDCDGEVDEGVIRDTICGVGKCTGNSGTEACTAGSWGGDTCNPFTGATTETCNNIDDDCDGSTDEGGVCSTNSYYCDDDGDGYIDASADGSCSTFNCIPAGCRSAQGNDCEDTNTNIHPGKAEVCDGVDQDCDGIVDNGVTTTFYGDADSDGYGNPSSSTQACTQPTGYVNNNQDCNDGNPNIKPGATESCNNIDDDCDGTKDESLTRSSTCGVGRCSGNTGVETCTAGSWEADTCNPLDGAIAESCNNIDDDCDGSTDEGLTQTQSCGTNTGECVSGAQTRSCALGSWESWGSCGGAYVGPNAEVCDGKDNDCDGDTDEGIFCALAAPEPVITLNSDDTVTLSWPTITSAESYKIYSVSSCSGLSGSFTVLASGLTSNSWTDTTASAHPQRYYKVAAVRGVSENASSRIIGKYEIALAAGWNLASVPLSPTHSSIKPFSSSFFSSLHNNSDLDFGPVFSGSYDFVVGPTSEASTVLGSFDPRVPSMIPQNLVDVSKKVSFHIHMSRPDTLTVVGMLPHTSNITFPSPGWYWIGYPSCVSRNIKPFNSSVLTSLHDGVATDFGFSFDGSYDFLIGPSNSFNFLGTFDPHKPSALPQNLEDMVPGRGYILHLTADDSFVVHN